MKNTFNLRIDADKALHPVSSMLFGLFLEDINYSCDGGLNANLVNNYSFDGIYLSRKRYGEFRAFLFKPDPQQAVDRLRYWHVDRGRLESRHDGAITPESWYARLSVDGCSRLENHGYNGRTADSRRCAMAISAGQTYRLGCWLRTPDFQGCIEASVTDVAGQPLTDSVSLAGSVDWHECAARLTGIRPGYGKLVLRFEGTGDIDLDGVSLVADDHWGRDNPKWRQGKLRRDLVEALRELRPRFLRFPGGCIVEGNGPGNEYDWRDTVGPLLARKPKYNLWGGHLKDGGYSQSYQIGFYEYFLLCEDLGMEPLPTLFAGLNCQFRSRHRVEIAGEDFEQRVLAQYLDLIDYAKGDPATSRWAALRAEAGHPEPFNLNYIGIGNENHGRHYLESFALIKRAVESRCPGITCVMASGAFPKGEAFDDIWATARRDYPDVIIDEHCYARPAWFIAQHGRFDDYDRQGPKAYMGEYAANFPMGIRPMALKPNCYETALAEAVFLAGLERNSDVVAMSSYAPLLSLCEAAQWPHNLINFNPAHVLRTANYFVQMLFSATVGIRVVAVEGDLPEGVYASATATDAQLIVKLININAYSVNANLQLHGVPDGHARIDSLQSDNLKAANAMRFDGEPDYRIAPRRCSSPVRAGEIALELQRFGIYVVVADV